jgi:hypothetical protein
MPDGPVIIRSDGSQSSGRIVDPADWTLGLAPCALTFIRVDHQAIRVSI